MYWNNIFTCVPKTEAKADSMITLTSSTGRITSPDTTGRGMYDDNVDVLWIIEAPDGLIIQFHLVFAQIRYSLDCVEDVLRVSGFYSLAYYEPR